MDEPKRLTPPFVLPEADAFSVIYNRRYDILSLVISDPPPAVGTYLDDDVLVRVEPRTKRVVGFEIESLIGFLCRHPELRESLWPLRKRKAAETITAYVAQRLAASAPAART